MDDDEQFAVSYQGVSPGVPVLTKDGTQFGILEHVLEVPEEDVFDGIVVWTGGGGWLDRRVQRDLSRDKKRPPGGWNCSSRSISGSSTRTMSRRSRPATSAVTWTRRR